MDVMQHMTGCHLLVSGKYEGIRWNTIVELDGGITCAEYYNYEYTKHQNFANKAICKWSHSMGIILRLGM